MTYCTVPEGLGARGLRALERYAAETGVALIREQRGEERRVSEDRRVRERLGRFRSVERRTICNSGGRRVAERRAATVPVTPPAPLPRRLRAHSEQIRFIEPLEISPEHIEDVATARLLVRFQAGEKQLFRALYAQWFDRVYTYARAALERSMLAEQATQEVFAELYDSLPHHEVGAERFRSWLAVIARRRIQGHLIALYGAEPIEDEPLPQSSRTSHAVPHWVKDPDLQVLVSRLPLSQRHVMMLRYLMGLSQAEVAGVVERSPQAVADLHAVALSVLSERQHAIGQPSAASGARFAMARRRRTARVTQSRRLALTPG